MPTSLLSDLIVSQIVAINRIHAQTREPVLRKNREHWAIALKTAGQTVYLAHGKEFLSDPGHAVLLPRGSTYSWICREPGECLMLEFDVLSVPYGNDPVSIRIGNMPELANIVNYLDHVWIFKKQAYQIKCLAGLYDILSRLADAESLTYQISAKHRLIQASVDYLEAHYNDPGLDNDRLAALSGISTVYFRKVFAGIYHESPMKYVQSIRIAKAKDLLIGELCSIREIAETVGFESIYHFSKLFKKVTGCTPSDFARLHKATVYDISSME